MSINTLSYSPLQSTRVSQSAGPRTWEWIWASPSTSSLNRVQTRSRSWESPSSIRVRRVLLQYSIWMYRYWRPFVSELSLLVTGHSCASSESSDWIEKRERGRAKRERSERERESEREATLSVWGFHNTLHAERRIVLWELQTPASVIKLPRPHIIHFSKCLHQSHKLPFIHCPTSVINLTGTALHSTSNLHSSFLFNFDHETTICYQSPSTTKTLYTTSIVRPIVKVLKAQIRPYPISTKRPIVNVPKLHLILYPTLIKRQGIKAPNLHLII